MLTAALLNIFLQVSAFSTWEKELHKIVFDPRYLLLNSEERKQVMLEPGEKATSNRAERLPAKSAANLGHSERLGVKSGESPAWSCSVLLSGCDP